MRIAGRAEEISVDEYADQVARQVADRVRAALSTRLAAGDAGEGDDQVPDPAAVAESLSDVIMLMPHGSTNELARLLAPFWSAVKVRQVFDGASRQLLAERRKSGTLLGLKTSDGDIVYPVFQFQQREGRVEVRPGLVPMLRVLRRFDPWSVAVLLHAPAPELRGRTPLSWVREGRPAAPLIELAEAVAREWSSGAA